MSCIGFGTWAWGNKFLWGYDPERDDEILKETFECAVNGGMKLIDTADSYGTGVLKGKSEELLGKFLKSLPQAKLNKITVATKLAPYPWRLGRDGFKKAFYLSQKRLQGKLDRVQLHWSTSRYAPWQEIDLIDGLCDLKERGEVKEIGVSNMGPKRLKWFHERLIMRGINLKSVQIQFSLLSPNPERYLIMKNLCEELNIQIIAYSPLALGVLAIAPGERKIGSTFLRKQLFNRLLQSSEKLRKKLHEIARYRKVSQSQVAINWCKSNGSIPIPGIRNPKQARDIIESNKWNLNQKEESELSLISSQCKNRMPSNPFQSN